MGRSKLACGEPFMIQTEHLRSKCHRATELRDDPRWSSLKEQAMQRKLRAREKRQTSARRLKLIQQRRLTINKNMYVVLNIQSLESGLNSHFFCAIIKKTLY